LTLKQNLVNKNLISCADCLLSTNLWLCLVCGNTGCGRKNWDGTGGNGHAVSHYEKSHHPLVVKLGTITA
jgi:ubiquitin carboxyl-terminal hydrolase 5/13